MGGLDLVVRLLENGDLMGKVAETARLYWTNSALTVNVFRYRSQILVTNITNTIDTKPTSILVYIYIYIY